MKIDKNCRHRLLDDRGETLVETLCAILIAALSIALLFACVVASNRINSQANAADANYYNTLSGAEKYGTKIQDATITISVSEPSASSASFPVELYSGDGAGKKIYSYKEAP